MVRLGRELTCKMSSARRRICCKQATAEERDGGWEGGGAMVEGRRWIEGLKDKGEKGWKATASMAGASGPLWIPLVGGEVESE